MSYQPEIIAGTRWLLSSEPRALLPRDLETIGSFLQRALQLPLPVIVEMRPTSVSQWRAMGYNAQFTEPVHSIAEWVSSYHTRATKHGAAFEPADYWELGAMLVRGFTGRNVVRFRTLESLKMFGSVREELNHLFGAAVEVPYTPTPVCTESLLRKTDAAIAAFERLR